MFVFHHTLKSSMATSMMIGHRDKLEPFAIETMRNRSSLGNKMVCFCKIALFA